MTHHHPLSWNEVGCATQKTIPQNYISNRNKGWPLWQGIGPEIAELWYLEICNCGTNTPWGWNTSTDIPNIIKNSMSEYVLSQRNWAWGDQCPSCSRQMVALNTLWWDYANSGHGLQGITTPWPQFWVILAELQIWLNNNGPCPSSYLVSVRKGDDGARVLLMILSS